MEEQWNIGEPGGPAGPFYSIVSSTGRVIALQIPDRETAERICKLPELEAEAVRELRARAIELETQLAPLQQQFDDWAEQNRRAEAEAHRRREELDMAIQRLIRKERWAAAWKRKAKMLRDWYFYAEKHIFRSQELSQRVNELEADNARLRAALEAVEWVHNSKEESVCAWCGGADPYPEPEMDLYDNNEDFEDAMEEWRKWTGHAPDCQRQQALEGAP